MRKALISPGFGAGWSTWQDGELKKDFLFDAELIKASESGVPLGFDGYSNDPDDGSPLAEFVERLRAKHGPDVYFYLGGARDLTVREVGDQPFQVDEYDGAEGIRYRDAGEWF